MGVILLRLTGQCVTQNGEGHVYRIAYFYIDPTMFISLCCYFILPCVEPYVVVGTSKTFQAKLAADGHFQQLFLQIRYALQGEIYCRGHWTGTVVVVLIL